MNNSSYLFGSRSSVYSRSEVMIRRPATANCPVGQTFLSVGLFRGQTGMSVLQRVCQDLPLD